MDWENSSANLGVILDRLRTRFSDKYMEIMSNLSSPQIAERLPQALNQPLYERWNEVRELRLPVSEAGNLGVRFVCSLESALRLLFSGCVLVLLRVLAQLVPVHLTAAVTAGGFTKRQTETKNLKGWCSSFVLWLCRLSKKLFLWIQSFWPFCFHFSTCIGLFTSTEIHYPSWRTPSPWWNARSRSKPHLVLVASKPCYEDRDATEFVTPLSGRGSDSSLSDVTRNDFWNTSIRFISKFLSCCYVCEIISTWTYLTLVINHKAGRRCHTQHSLLASAAKHLAA